LIPPITAPCRRIPWSSRALARPSRRMAGLERDRHQRAAGHGLAARHHPGAAGAPRGAWAHRASGQVLGGLGESTAGRSAGHRRSGVLSPSGQACRRRCAGRCSRTAWMGSVRAGLTGVGRRSHSLHFL